MATINQVLEGLKIFAKYGGDEYLVAAEHDVIFAGPWEPLSEEDNKRLEELGWHFDEYADSWAKFV